MSEPTEMRNLIMIGDKLAHTARALGVLPRAMVTSQIPLIEDFFPGIDHLECTRCIMTTKRRILHTAAKRGGIQKILLEKDTAASDYWCGLNPSEMENELTSDGYEVSVVDFSQGIHHGIRDTGKILGRDKLAERLIKHYDAQLEEVTALLPLGGKKRVAAFVGFMHPMTHENFLIPQACDSFLSQKVMEPLGLENALEDLAPLDELSPAEMMQRLTQTAPEVIVITGNAQAGLMAIRDAADADPAFREVPAVKNHAVHALPACSGGEPADYPQILGAWAHALGYKERGTI